MLINEIIEAANKGLEILKKPQLTEEEKIIMNNRLVDIQESLHPYE